MMPLMDLSVSNFVKPYAQPALDGAEGLTDEDLAKSLGVRAIDFKNRFFELGYDKVLRELGLNFEIIAEKSGARGRPKQVLVFSTDVARILVANYPNNIGMGYAAWLIQRAHHHFEEVVADNMRLRNENHTLAASQKKPRQTALPSARNVLTVTLVKGMFGLEYVPAKVRRNQMTTKQSIAAKGLHILDVVKGAVEAFVHVQEDLADEELRSHEPDDLIASKADLMEMAKTILTAIHAHKHGIKRVH